MPTQGQLDGEAATNALKASVVDLLVAVGMAESAGDADGSPLGGNASANEADWTPRQILAHIVWWHERYLKVVSATVDGRPRPKLAGKLDEINVVGVEAYGDRSMDDLADTLRAKEHALESLVGVLFELPASERSKVRIVTRDESAPIDLDGFVQRVTGHLHGHARDLRARTKAR
jgi:DinB superfamily